MADRLAVKKEPAGRFSLVLPARDRAVPCAEPDTSKDSDRDGIGSASTNAPTAKVVYERVPA